ncbi:polysaccharide lyase family 7 protein [Microvirga sp. P5_D2]
MTLNPDLPPSGNFDLTKWKIGLPIDSNGGYSGTATEVKNLIGYEHPTYFYTGPDGAMVFAAPVEGATTSGSNYARSELLEMNGTVRAAWNLQQGGFMAAALEIDQAPIKFSGVAGRIVVGQIHGLDNELVRLYWENNKIYFVNGQAGATNTATTFYLTNANGEQPNVSINESFSYTIHAKGDDLLVRVEADGQTYTSLTRINDVWDSDVFYFKAGTYLGVNETQGTGWGQTSFYNLTFNHDGTPPSDQPMTTRTFTGTSSSNTLLGSAENDLIDGRGGDDRLYGKGGSDVLIGGTGRDNFYFDTNPGTTNKDVIVDFNINDDTIRLENAIFTKLASTGSLSSSWFRPGTKALDSNDYIIYDNATGVLLYDSDGTGTRTAIQIALIENKANLSRYDFTVY